MENAINHTKLVMELTSQDERESKRKGYNPYALGIVLNAAEGINTTEDFAKAFNATPGMHRVARRLGLELGVVCGKWTCRCGHPKHEAQCPAFDGYWCDIVTKESKTGRTK